MPKTRQDKVKKALMRSGRDEQTAERVASKCEATMYRDQDYGAFALYLRKDGIVEVAHDSIDSPTVREVLERYCTPQHTTGNARLWKVVSDVHPSAVLSTVERHMAERGYAQDRLAERAMFKVTVDEAHNPDLPVEGGANIVHEAVERGLLQQLNLVTAALRESFEASVPSVQFYARPNAQAVNGRRPPFAVARFFVESTIDEARVAVASGRAYRKGGLWNTARNLALRLGGIEADSQYGQLEFEFADAANAEKFMDGVNDKHGMYGAAAQPAMLESVDANEAREIVMKTLGPWQEHLVKVAVHEGAIEIGIALPSALCESFMASALPAFSNNELTGARLVEFTLDNPIPEGDRSEIEEAARACTGAVAIQAEGTKLVAQVPSGFVGHYVSDAALQERITWLHGKLMPWGASLADVGELQEVRQPVPERRTIAELGESHEHNGCCGEGQDLASYRRSLREEEDGGYEVADHGLPPEVNTMLTQFTSVKQHLWDTPQIQNVIKKAKKLVKDKHGADVAREFETKLDIARATACQESINEAVADRKTIMHMAARHGGNYMGVGRIRKLNLQPAHYWTFSDFRSADAFVGEFLDEFGHGEEREVVAWPARGGLAAGAAVTYSIVSESLDEGYRVKFGRSDHELLASVHGGQGDPVYALVSRTVDRQPTMASQREIEAAIDALYEFGRPVGDAQRLARDLESMLGESINEVAPAIARGVAAAAKNPTVRKVAKHAAKVAVSYAAKKVADKRKDKKDEAITEAWTAAGVEQAKGNYGINTPKGRMAIKPARDGVHIELGGERRFTGSVDEAADFLNRLFGLRESLDEAARFYFVEKPDGKQYSHRDDAFSARREAQRFAKLYGFAYVVTKDDRYPANELSREKFDADGNVVRESEDGDTYSRAMELRGIIKAGGTFEADASADMDDGDDDDAEPDMNET